MASGSTLATFYPEMNRAPVTNPATFDLRREGFTVLDFDPTTNEIAIFFGLMPSVYADGGVTVEVHFMATTGTSGNVIFNGYFERVAGQDADADGYAAAQASAATAVNGTNGIESIASIAFTNGAQMDSVVAGDAFRFKLERNAASASDTLTGSDAEVTVIEIVET